jgi:hypothetical protein
MSIKTVFLMLLFFADKKTGYTLQQLKPAPQQLAGQKKEIRFNLEY